MKIVDLQVIPFWVPRKPYRNGEILPGTKNVQTVTKIITDEGTEGYCFGDFLHGDWDGLPADMRATLKGQIKSLVLGQDPFDREKFWQLMWAWQSIMPENLISVLDMILWDLQGRAFGVPVHKLLGGCREKVKAYASSFPDMGDPEVYTQHALECIGERVYNLQRMFNVREGIRKSDDMLPEICLKLPEFGKYASVKECEIKDQVQMLEEYYEARGWDKETGVPLERET